MSLFIGETSKPSFLTSGLDVVKQLLITLVVLPLLPLFVLSDRRANQRKTTREMLMEKSGEAQWFERANAKAKRLSRKGHWTPEIAVSNLALKQAYEHLLKRQREQQYQRLVSIGGTGAWWQTLSVRYRFRLLVKPRGPTHVELYCKNPTPYKVLVGNLDIQWKRSSRRELVELDVPPFNVGALKTVKKVIEVQRDHIPLRLRADVAGPDERALIYRTNWLGSQRKLRMSSSEDLA